MTNTRSLPTTHAERITLLHDALEAALDGLRDISTATRSRMMHDDYEDYARAARNQIIFCTTLLTDDGLDAETFDSIFTMTADDLYNSCDEMTSLAASFIYGYADHGSPISDLMIANDDD